MDAPSSGSATSLAKTQTQNPKLVSSKPFLLKKLAPKNDQASLKNQLSGASAFSVDSADKKSVVDKTTTTPSTRSKFPEDGVPKREEWKNKWQFLMNLCGYCLGLGDLWSFPKLVYTYGGGTFILVYFLLLITLGIPLCFMELALGQFTSSGAANIFKMIAPATEGIGWGAIVVQAILNIYYSCNIGWMIFFLISTFKTPVPWQECGTSWHTRDCVSIYAWRSCEASSIWNVQKGHESDNGIYFHNRCYNESNVMEIFHALDECLAHTDIKNTSEADRLQVWQQREECRVDMKFEYFGTNSSMQKIIKHHLMENNIENEPSPNEKNVFRLLLASPSKNTGFQTFNRLANTSRLHLRHKNHSITIANFVEEYCEDILSYEMGNKLYPAHHFHGKHIHNLKQVGANGSHFSRLVCVYHIINQFDGNAKFPSQQLFSHSIQNPNASLSNLYGIDWGVAIGCLICWILCALGLVGTLSHLGNIMIVCFPPVLIIFLACLMYSATLEGAGKGYQIYLRTEWEHFGQVKLWKSAVTHILYTIALGNGGLMHISSFNPFRRNILAGTFIVVTANAVLSVLSGFLFFGVTGALASRIDKPISELFHSYEDSILLVMLSHLCSQPENKAVGKMLAVFAFAMAAVLGLTSLITQVHILVVHITDKFPVLRNHKWRVITVIAICCVTFLLSLPGTTRGGQYYTAFVAAVIESEWLVMVLLFEVVVVAWIYGSDKFCADIFMMLGSKHKTSIGTFLFTNTTKWFWIACWKFITPAILCLTLLYCFVEALTPGLEMSHRVARWLGFLTFCGIMAYFFIYNKYVLNYKCKDQFRPNKQWGPARDDDRIEPYIPLGEEQ